MTQNVFITGSNRGIGLELTREYLIRGAHVVATCRQPDQATQLQQLQNQYAHTLTILPLTVDDPDSLATCARTVTDHLTTLDILINNAGIYPQTPESQKFGYLEAEPMRQVLEINSIAPVLVTQALAPLLKRGTNPRLIMVSSGMGSIDGVKSTNGMSYRMSKAALNMATRVLADALALDGIITITTHPGWVQTDMGGADAALTPQQSARDLIALTDKLTPADNGKFFNHTGEPLPW